MKLPLLTLLIATACTIITLRQPVMQAHAVTDGRLTLGAVPSESETGLQVYRLLLCKNFSTYDPSMFNDSEVCQAALVDDAQREVVVVPDKLRRSFATKFSHHALVTAAGVAAFTAAAIGIYKWFPKVNRMVEDLGRKINTAYDQNHALHKDKYDKVVDEVEKELKNIKIEDKKRIELEKNLDLSLLTASEYRLREVLSNIRAIDAGVADKLEAGVFGGRVDAETLEMLARRVEDLDASFAKRLHQAKLVNIPLNDDGLLYFSTLAKQAFDMKHSNDVLVAKLNKLQRLGKIPADYFDESEKLFLHQLHHAVSNLLSASLLRSLEIEKDLLLNLKNRKIKIEHVSSVLKKEEMQDITSKYIWSVDSFAGYHQGKNDIVAKITQSAQIDDVYNYNALLERYQIIGNIDYEEIKLISKRDAYRNAMDNVVKHVGSSSLERNVDNRVKQLNLRIAKTSETLFNSALDAVEEGHYVSREVELWSKLAEVRNESLQLRQEKLHLLKQEIATFEQQIIERQKTITDEQNTIKKINKENTGRKKLILERRGEALKELKAAEEMLRKGRDEEFAALSKKSEQRRKKWLIFGSGGGIAGVAVMIAIDKSIWGYGERQLGEHWNQIFNEEAEFDDATPVKDINGVLEKLAAIFGYKVNSSALALAN